MIVGQRWGPSAITGKTDRTNRAFRTITGSCLVIVGHPRQMQPLLTHDHARAAINVEALQFVEHSHVLRVLFFHVVKSFQDHHFTSMDDRSSNA